MYTAMKRGPSIGEPAPFFETSLDDSTITLNDFRGNWLIVLSHPEDLIPIFKTRTLNYLLCKRRTRVISLGERKNPPGTKGRNFLKKYIRKQRVTAIDDSDGGISRSYGLGGNSDMSGAAKGVFVIDPKGVLRVKLYFSPETERNFYEILKLLDTLQASDKHKSGPARTKGWRRHLGIVVRQKTLAKQE